jgi:hypothetical protein
MFELKAAGIGCNPAPVQLFNTVIEGSILIQEGGSGGRHPPFYDAAGRWFAYAGDFVLGL